MAKTVGPLLVIVGETATGKSALAIDIATKFHGEIIAADSRTPYKGMDIGTAKPSTADQTKVPHHLLDITTPDKPISVADFKLLANQAIGDITKRGKLPILVGGTGLYIDAVLYDFQFRSPTTKQRREELSQLSVDELQRRLQAEGIALPVNKLNPRHLVRALETNGQIPTPHPLRARTLILGLTLDRKVLQQNITNRVDAMITAGLVNEVKNLGVTYGWNGEVFRTPGYIAFRAYAEGHISLEEAKRRFIKADLNLAKRQRTWFKRNESIQWINKQIEAVDLITTFLNK